jgi:hypothetical protein
MMSNSLDLPVVLFVFNRPHLTNLAFERLRAVRPKTLLVVADGPRRNQPRDPMLCSEVRQIVERVDWPCELLKEYSDENLGCGPRVSSGMDWAFRTVEEAAILEDDCQPEPGFYRFCQEMLERYRDEPHVMQVCGSNFLFGRARPRASYYFSRYPICWGWATWRRAWSHFDFDMKKWRVEANQHEYLSQFDDPKERAFWKESWDRMCAGLGNTWDYQWVFACMAARGLSIVPAVNLVRNVGFGVDATHTRSRLMALTPPTGRLDFPLVHPATIERDETADRVAAQRLFQKRGLLEKVAEGIRRKALSGWSRVWSPNPAVG